MIYRHTSGTEIVLHIPDPRLTVPRVGSTLYYTLYDGKYDCKITMH